MSVPWSEKHRPRRWSEMRGHEEMLSRLAALCGGGGGGAPHLLLAGPPGVGKTTAVLCLADELLGAAKADALLELNASNDRGIDVVRNKIKMFAQRKVTLPPGRRKIVVLDEADSMTEGAQQALRRTMELYGDTTRFALACNDSSKIIEAVQSRCATLRFARLSDEQVIAKLVEVCQKEGVEYARDGLEAIAFVSQGDLRRALNDLQATASGFGRVDEPNVFRVCDEPHPLVVRDALVACSEGRVRDACALLDELRARGYAAEDVVANMFRVCTNLELDEPRRLAFVREIGLTRLRIADGLDSPLQTSALLARLCDVSTRLSQTESA